MKNHNYKICDKMFARNISRELKYKRVNWRRRRWKTIITKICDKMLARNISRELKYKRVNWRRRRWKTIITKICDKIFARNISRELKYKRVNWRRRRWKTIITKFVIKCLHVIYQGNYIKGTEIQKSQLKAKKVKNHNYKNLW